MSRRMARGRRRPTGPGRGHWIQLGALVLGLALLLSFRDEIGDGTAGCYQNLASGGAAPAPVLAPAPEPSVGEGEAPDAALPSPAPGATAVEVKVVRFSTAPPGDPADPNRDTDEPDAAPSAGDATP